MKGCLLDTNGLMALHWPSHEHHDRVVRWFARYRSKDRTTCPLAEAGFVRIPR
jgi:predicted nucleic acid-binding protein